MKSGLRAPLSIDINITNRCNFACSFCSASPNKKGFELNELTLVEIDSIFQYAEDEGVFVVRLAGGEPLVRDDFQKIAEAAAKYTFSKILLSNGSLLTPEIVQTLRAAGFNSVALSVDGHDAAVHEKSRAARGSFNSLHRAIEVLEMEGVPHTAMVTVTAFNVSHLTEILKFIISMRFHAVNFILLAASGKARYRLNLFPTPDAWRSELLRLSLFLNENKPSIPVSVLPPHEDPIPRELYLPLKESGRLDLLKQVWGIDFEAPVATFTGCAAGKTQMTVFENGDVYGCDLMRDSRAWCAGNVRDDSLSDIWHNSPTFQALRNLKKSELGEPCGNCAVNECGGGCRASAFNTSGSLIGGDLTCLDHTQATS